MASRLKPKDITVVVSGGTGSTLVDIDGRAELTCLKAPSATAKFNFEVFDAGGFGIFGRDDIKGSKSIAIHYPTTDDMTFRIVNADEDGTYSIRIYGEFD